MSTTIPKSHPVQPLKPGQSATDRVTCGTCGLSWDDAIPTEYTPAPAARCPFEAFHVYDEDDDAGDDDDYSGKYVPNRPRTNEDLVRDLMNYNPTGAVCQLFIMEAIQKYAKACAEADPKKFDNDFMDGAVWVKCAQHIKAKCDEFYARHDAPAPDETEEDKWRTRFGAQADAEGWGIFNGEEIQRDDEADKFASDDEAIEFVRKCAGEGSECHRLALAICAEWLADYDKPAAANDE